MAKIGCLNTRMENTGLLVLGLLCIDDMWDGGHGGHVCADASIVSIGQANRNYIAMFNHVFEDEQE